MSGLPTPTDRPEIAFPIKATKEGPITDNPNDLQQGHFGIQTEANGSGAYYCPIANDAADPKPAPVKLNISNAVIEELVGTVDGVNKIFTIPSGAPDSDFGLAFWNGRLAYGDYTVSGDTVTFITAPATNTDVWFVYNLVLSGPGGAPLDSTNIADASTLGGPTVKDSLDTADAKIATKISQLDNIITVSPSGGDFTSVKDAIDSITDNDISNRYVVQVGPGIYSENNPIQGKEYVTIVSTGDLQTTRIVAANGSNHRVYRRLADNQNRCGKWQRKPFRDGQFVYRQRVVIIRCHRRDQLRYKSDCRRYIWRQQVRICRL
ncbi:MAG: hypothetical protein ACYTEX_28655 [Planctomycetota bacterium]|jgi:hypothetical protein